MSINNMSTCFRSRDLLTHQVGAIQSVGRLNQVMEMKIQIVNLQNCGFHGNRWHFLQLQEHAADGGPETQTPGGTSVNFLGGRHRFGRPNPKDETN